MVVMIRFLSGDPNLRFVGDSNKIVRFNTQPFVNVSWVRNLNFMGFWCVESKYDIFVSCKNFSQNVSTFHEETLDTYQYWHPLSISFTT